MSAALVIASLAAALTAQAGATDISQIGASQVGGASGSAAAISPLEPPLSPGPASGASSASAPAQVAPEGASRSAATTQVSPAGRDTAPPDQLSKRDRSSATTQVTGQRRTASAPPALSSVHEGHVVSTIVVHGRDRCNPVEGQALPADCANIVDQRPDDFAPPPPPGLSPDEMLVAGTPSRNPNLGDITGLTNSLTGAEGAEAAASLGVVTQTLLSTANTAPVLGTSVSATVNAATSATGLSSATLPGGIVVTVLPAPK